MDHSSRLQFDEEEGKERPNEKVSYRKARHRPRCSTHDCAETCSTSALVAGGCERSSCTSEWCAYTRGVPTSTIPHVYAQHPRVDSLSPSLGSRRWFRQRPSVCVKRPLTCASNTNERAPDAI